MRRPVIGLRGQLLLTLGSVFLCSLGLLLFATLQLTRRQAERTTRAQLQTWAIWLSDGEGKREIPAHVVQRLQRLHDHGLLRGATLGRREDRLHLGVAEGPPTLAGHTVSGVPFALWLAPDMGTATPALRRLLGFYLSVTFACALLLSYGLLTHRLIRPLRLATEQAERLSHGQWRGRLPLQGAAEVVRLARAFNAMALALTKEQTLLQGRVAELEQTTRELESAQQQVVRGDKLASVGRLAAGIAHEIGNPLAAILGLLELVRAGDLAPETQAEFLSRVVKETERIHAILGNLLDFARKEPASAGPCSPVALAPLIEGTLTLVQNQRSARDIHFVVDLNPEASAVLGAEAPLSQVLLNLLLNAMDALNGRGQIVISTRRRDDRVLLIVEDDGPGLCPEIAQQVFEPFVTSKPPGQGTGLGLAVSAALCAQMGGTITGENRSPAGARFRIELARA